MGDSLIAANPQYDIHPRTFVTRCVTRASLRLHEQAVVASSRPSAAAWLISQRSVLISFQPRPSCFYPSGPTTSTPARKSSSLRKGLAPRAHPCRQ